MGGQDQQVQPDMHATDGPADQNATAKSQDQSSQPMDPYTAVEELDVKLEQLAERLQHAQHTFEALLTVDSSAPTKPELHALVWQITSGAPDGFQQPQSLAALAQLASDHPNSCLELNVQHVDKSTDAPISLWEALKQQPNLYEAVQEHLACQFQQVSLQSTLESQLSQVRHDNLRSLAGMLRDSVTQQAAKWRVVTQAGVTAYYTLDQLHKQMYEGQVTPETTIQNHSHQERPLGLMLRHYHDLMYRVQSLEYHAYQHQHDRSLPAALLEQLSSLNWVDTTSCWCWYQSQPQLGNASLDMGGPMSAAQLKQHVADGTIRQYHCPVFHQELPGALLLVRDVLVASKQQKMNLQQSLQNKAKQPQQQQSAAPVKQLPIGVPTSQNDTQLHVNEAAEEQQPADGTSDVANDRAVSQAADVIEAGTTQENGLPAQYANPLQQEVHQLVVASLLKSIKEGAMGLLLRSLPGSKEEPLLASVFDSWVGQVATRIAARDEQLAKQKQAEEEAKAKRRAEEQAAIKQHLEQLQQREREREKERERRRKEDSERRANASDDGRKQHRDAYDQDRRRSQETISKQHSAGYDKHAGERDRHSSHSERSKHADKNQRVEDNHTAGKSEALKRRETSSRHSSPQDSHDMRKDDRQQDSKARSHTNKDQAMSGSLDRSKADDGHLKHRERSSSRERGRHRRSCSHSRSPVRGKAVDTDRALVRTHSDKDKSVKGRHEENHRTTDGRRNEKQSEKEYQRHDRHHSERHDRSRSPRRRSGDAVSRENDKRSQNSHHSSRTRSRSPKNNGRVRHPRSRSRSPQRHDRDQSRQSRDGRDRHHKDRRRSYSRSRSRSPTRHSRSHISSHQEVRDDHLDRRSTVDSEKDKQRQHEQHNHHSHQHSTRRDDSHQRKHSDEHTSTKQDKRPQPDADDQPSSKRSKAERDAKHEHHDQHHKDSSRQPALQCALSSPSPRSDTTDIQPQSSPHPPDATKVAHASSDKARQQAVPAARGNQQATGSKQPASNKPSQPLSSVPRFVSQAPAPKYRPSQQQAHALPRSLPNLPSSWQSQLYTYLTTQDRAIMACVCKQLWVLQIKYLALPSKPLTIAVSDQHNSNAGVTLGNAAVASGQATKKQSASRQQAQHTKSEKHLLEAGTPHAGQQATVSSQEAEQSNYQVESEHPGAPDAAESNSMEETSTRQLRRQDAIKGKHDRNVMQAAETALAGALQIDTGDAGQDMGVVKVDEKPKKPAKRKAAKPPARAKPGKAQSRKSVVEPDTKTEGTPELSELSEDVSVLNSAVIPDAKADSLNAVGSTVTDSQDVATVRPSKKAKTNAVDEQEVRVPKNQKVSRRELQGLLSMDVTWGRRSTNKPAITAPADTTAEQGMAGLLSPRVNKGSSKELQRLLAEIESDDEAETKPVARKESKDSIGQAASKQRQGDKLFPPSPLGFAPKAKAVRSGGRRARGEMPSACARMLPLGEMKMATQRRVVVPGHKRQLDEPVPAVISNEVPDAGNGGRGSKKAGNKKSLNRNTVAAMDEASAAAAGLVTDAGKWQAIAARAKPIKFGRSKIQGWGMFAIEPIEPDEFVIEYIGEAIRVSLADARERLYQALGLDDYMFRVDTEIVVDATRKGGAARFINHCCDPNCFTKIITVDGVKHIGIYAKRRIEPGEELSYDYKFQEETDPARKVPCSCGAKNCRKWMC